MARYARYYSVARRDTAPRLEQAAVEIAEPVAEPAATADFTELRKDALVDLAQQRGLDTSGTKAELAERLRG